MKQFSIGMVISAVDQVTAPVRNMVKSVTASSAQMAEAMNKASARISMGPKGEGVFAGVFKAEALMETVKAAGEQVSEFGKSCVEAGDEADISLKRLKTLMMNVRGTTLENVRAVSELAEKISMKTVIEKSALVSGQSQLAGFNLTTNQIKKLTPLLADLGAKQWG